MKKSKSHYSVWSKPLIASTMLVAALFVYANPEQSNIPDPALENRPYHHPFFQDDGLARGISFDTLKGADGSSYTVQQGISVGESGVVEKFSGVVKVEKRQLSPQERQAKAIEKERKHGRKSKEKPLKVARGLTKFLAEGPPNNPMPIEVLVSVVRTPEVPLFHKMEKAAAEGKIRTKADHKRERERLLGERKSKIRDAKNSVLNAITGLGGEVLHNPKNLHSITARIPANAIDNLANRRDVARIDLNLPDQDEIDGSHMIEGHQIKQFIDDGYDGGSGTDIVFAQIEINGADDEHVGFRDGSGSIDRIKGMYNCYSTDCTSTSNFTSSQESDHASSVAGIIFGDLRDGQDTGVTSSSERIKRSGYAGEAHGWLYRAGNSASTMHAFDNMADKTGTDKPAVVNMSAGNADADPDCLGRTDRSKAVNELFESGILLIKSAGNKQDDAPQPPSVTDCRVTEPGSAIGAFTVASLGSNASSGDTDDVRDATISDFSSRGGTSP